MVLIRVSRRHPLRRASNLHQAGVRSYQRWAGRFRRGSNGGSNDFALSGLSAVLRTLESSRLHAGNQLLDPHWIMRGSRYAGDGGAGDELGGVAFKDSERLRMGGAQRGEAQVR